MQNLESLLQEIEKADTIAVDTETVSIQDKTMVGFSYAFLVKGRAKRYYIPVKHTQIKNLSKVGIKKLLTILTKQATLIFHNYAFDAQVLFQAGYKLKYIPHDSMVIAHLLDENSSMGLKKLAKRLFHHKMLSFKEVCGVGKKQISFADVVDPVIIEKYAAEDAEYTLKVFLYLYHQLQKDKDLSILYGALERPLLPVVASMHNHGITIDVKKVKAIKQICEDAQETFKSCLDANMKDINLNSSKQLREYFITKEKMPIIKSSRKTGNPSVDSEVLKIYAQSSPEADWILKYRYYSKLLSTFIPALTPTNPQNSTKSVKCKGKIYPSFNQAGTISGRFSSSSPNFQNLPLEDKLGIRKCIVADTGCVLIGADYSQIELRLAAHFSKDEDMIKAFNDKKDIHAITSKSVGCSRKQAKVINFGILYGMGAKSLAKKLKSSPEQALKFIDNYYKSYPKIREFILAARKEAYNAGVLQSFMGRKRHINPKFRHLDDYQREGELRSMVNFVIQGSAADIIKAAMVTIYKELVKKKLDAVIISQIHDELILQCKKEEVNIVKEIVERNMIAVGIGLRVPLEVQIGVGRTWEEIH